MVEPVSTVVPTVIAAGTVTLSGSVFGLQYEALLAGLVGAIVSLLYLPPVTALKSAGIVAGSALLAGYFAPVIATAALHFFPWLHNVGDFIGVACAAALGLGAHALIPACLKRMRTFIGGK